MYVFAYGSLLSPAGHPPQGAQPARLHGWQRWWGVAMDNTRDLPRYKHYLDGQGRRPAVHVAFLDLVPAPGQWVNGVALPVGAEQLARLDARERNYRRVEVSGGLDGVRGGPVWTYVGLDEARERRRHGLDTGRLVVSREYHERVLDGFAALGPRQLADFQASTAPLPCPLADLQVVHDAPTAARSAPARLAS
jgi:gamma-glutamyl AIG2-like cyclotransferase